MYRQNIVIDAWMREAQEAVKLVEDIETRVKISKNNIIITIEEQRQQQQQRFGDDVARSKLLEVGVKLDRLESLLHNPPTKPILTNDDLEHRWTLLSDTKLRMKALALTLYAMPSSPNRTGDSAVADTKETNRTANSYDNDQIKASFAKDEPELVKPLVSDNTTQSHMQFVLEGLLDCLWSPCSSCISIRPDKGIYILYDDVKACECEDVQVLWSIVVESNPPPPCHHIIQAYHTCKNGRRKQKPLPNGSC
ncbi:hypothetical protein JRO89_XS04G0168800 [Xanthoceras sorbifolium]|uniref:Uncharacterized protein n=1 Tax=Xanthoceras sorbifolium TaxID=99658 RepID=A0ABQ8I5M7_9ROSI|nr:hypothetical protein JRO89_XS04G0168800 [Xanthoceras sorbifolium]